VRIGVVAAHLHDYLAVAADHRRRHGVAIGLASLNHSLRDGYGDGTIGVRAEFTDCRLGRLGLYLGLVLPWRRGNRVTD
jgi:hypothetical protein